MEWQYGKEFFELLGEFCVDFEHFTHSMVTCIRVILDLQGLKDKDIQEVLLAGQTAEPLRSLLQNLTGQVLAKGEKEQRVCSKVFVYLQELIKERNDLLHSTWYIPSRWSKEFEDVPFGEKLYANKKGADRKRFILKTSELEAKIGKCQDAITMMSLLMRCLIGIKSIDDCFDIQKDQLVIKYEALKPIEIGSSDVNSV